MRTVLAVVPYVNGLRHACERLDLFQKQLERRRRCQAQHSIRVQEGQPNLRFRDFRTFRSRKSLRVLSRIYKQVKRLSVSNRQVAVLPGAVRNNEVEQTALFSRFLLIEQLPGVFREFE